MHVVIFRYTAPAAVCTSLFSGYQKARDLRCKSRMLVGRVVVVCSYAAIKYEASAELTIS